MFIHPLKIRSIKSIYTWLILISVACLTALLMPRALLAAETYQFVNEWPEFRLNSPAGVAFDASGNIYVADTRNGRIQKLDPNGNLITTWSSAAPGDSQPGAPAGVAIDRNGYVYVSDWGMWVTKFDANGNFITKWGSYGQGNGQFDTPIGIATDPSGNVYVVDNENNNVQKFDSSGNFLAKWGKTGPGIGGEWGAGSGDGEFWRPAGIAIDASGTVYVSDTGNARIQKLDSSGNFITKWGSWGQGDGQFAFGSFGNNVSLDASGNVLVAEAWNNRIQKFDSGGGFLAKWGGTGPGWNGSGSADGQFYYPSGIAVDSAGYVYVADTDNNRIQKFDASGSFLAKWGGREDAGYFYMPVGAAIDSSGTVYVSDAGNARIQKFDSSGNFITKWGSYGQGDGQFAFGSFVNNVSLDASGNVLVADAWNNRIQKFDSGGNFITKWGSYGQGDGQFHSPSGIAVDSAGNVFVADTWNNRIQKFDASGSFLAKWGGTGPVWDGSGSGDGQFSWPMGIAIDSSGNVYVADTRNNRIQKFDSNGSFLDKWGGTGPMWDGSGSGDGQFREPMGIAIDLSGNVYVAESGNNRIQKLDAYGNFITKWGRYGADHGHFVYPQGVAVGTNGNIYIADSWNNRIQQFSLGASGLSLPAPSNLAAEAVSDAEVRLTWLDNTAGEEGFEIERKEEPTGSWQIIAIAGADQTSYADSWLTPSTAYSYRIRAFTWNVQSDWSNEASATTRPPTLMGQITDASGNPLAGVKVLAYRTDAYDSYWNNGQMGIFEAEWADRWTETNENGTYTFTRQDLSAGNYKLRVIPPNGFLSEWWDDKADYGAADIVTIGDQSQQINMTVVADSEAPSGTISINGGDATSAFTEAVLNLTAADNDFAGVTQMRFSNETTAAWSNWETFKTTKNWLLTGGSGERTVWAQFRDRAGNVSTPVSDVIEIQSVVTNVELGNFGRIQSGERVVTLGGANRTFTISLDVTGSPTAVKAVVYVNGQPTTVDLVNVPVGSAHWEASVASATSGDIKLIVDSPETGLQEQIIGRVQLIDPSGYITDKDSGAPIADATVTLYRQNPETGQFEILDPSSGDNAMLMEPDINPQKSLADGYYGWDVAPGTYYVSVQKTGYENLDQSPLAVVPPAVTDLNIELRDSRAPGVPTELTGVAAGPTQIDLAWTGASDGESGLAGYRVYDVDTSQLLGETSQTSFSITGLQPGETHRYNVAAVDLAGNLSVPSDTVTATTQMPTLLTYLGDMTGDYSDIVWVRASMVDNNSVPVADKSVKFTLGAQEVTAVTDLLGQAHAAIKLEQSSGGKSLSVNFEGDGSYLQSRVESVFEINKEALSISYTGDLITQRYQAPAFRAQLAESDAEIGNLAGKAVVFTIDDGLTTATVPSVADADGLAVASESIDFPAGIYKVSAAFSGDGYYRSAETSPATFVVWEPIAGLSAKGSGKILKPGVKKAEFGFHIKYPKTSTFPKGEFEYEEEFKDASGKEKEIELESTAINWLVAADGLAVFDGQAAFEHQSGVHTFRVFAVDNGKPGAGGDTFELYLDGLPFASGTLIKGDVIIK